MVIFLLVFNSYAAITFNQYEQVLNQVEFIYSPIAKEQGKKLVIEKPWEKEGVDASKARLEGENLIIEMWGGYARREATTQDAFLAMACHELGHHFAGAPYWDEPGARWASAEGQADYFVTTKCLRRIWDGEDHQSIWGDREISFYVKEKCKQVYEGRDYYLCLRLAKAAYEMTYSTTNFKPERLHFETPSTWQTSFTYVRQHVGGQCRLDNLFAGALCSKSYEENFSSDNEVDGACLEGLGKRPRCWYLPRPSQL